MIDNGIDCKVASLNEVVLEAFSYKIDDGYIVNEKTTNSPKNMHGTIISNIIFSLCSEVQIYDFKILDENLQTDGRILIRAIEDAIKLNPDIIHLSLGTTNRCYEKELKKLVERAKEKDILIVAASSNCGELTFPASIKEVVAVKSIVGSNKYGFFNGYCLAPYSVFKENRIFHDGVCLNLTGNSVAAAYVSGQLAEIINVNDVGTNYECVSSYVEHIELKEKSNVR